MKRDLRIRTAVVAGWFYAAAMCGAADPPVVGAGTFIEQVRARAVEAGDREVTAAVDYNRLHLQAVAVDETIARPALEALAGSGDAFTVAWLEGAHAEPVTAALQPLAARVVERIRARLQASPEVPEKAARDWMLRTAVGDLTCNALEVPLKRFCQDWLKRHGADPAVQRQFEALDPGDERTRHAFDPATIRARAASYRVPAPPSAPAAPRSPRQAKD